MRNPFRGANPSTHQLQTASGVESLAAGYRQEASQTQHPGKRARVLGKAKRLERTAKDIRRGRDAGL